MNTNRISLDDFSRAVEAGNHQGALKALHEQLDAHPTVGTLYWLVATQHAELGQFDAAEAAFAQALSLDPGLHVARFQLGLLHFTSGRPATAMQTWAPLEQLDERHYLVFFKRGFAALAIDAFDDAILLFSRGIEANKENPPLNRDIHMMISEINRKRQDPAQGAPVPTEDEADANIDHLLASYRRNL